MILEIAKPETWQRTKEHRQRNKAYVYKNIAEQKKNIKQKKTTPYISHSTQTKK